MLLVSVIVLGLFAGFIAAIIIAASIVIKARIAKDYLVCPTCGHDVLNTSGIAQKCDNCGTRVFRKKDGTVARG